MEVKNKQDLMKQYISRMKDEGFNISMAEAKVMVNQVIESMKDCAYDSGLNITGFMSLTKEEKPARICRNPRTGEDMEVPAKTVLKVKLAKKVKELQD